MMRARARKRLAAKIAEEAIFYGDGEVWTRDGDLVTRVTGSVFGHGVGLRAFAIRRGIAAAAVRILREKGI